MEVLIIGIGGIGSFYSYILQQGGARISLVARSNVEAIKSNGININSAKLGQHKVKPAAVYSTPAEAASQGIQYDYVLCTTKSLPSSPTEVLIRPAISKNTTIVLIQNGLNIEQPVHAAFPDNKLIACVAYIGVWQTSPGYVEHSVLENIELALYPDGGDAVLTTFHETLLKGGSDAKIVPSANASQYRKLLWNTSFSSVCTITGLDTSGVTTCPSAKELVLSAMNEIIDIANAAGVALPRAAVQQTWDRTEKLGVAYKPSMMLDYEAGREMEVDVIVDAPVREAQRLGISVPTLKFIKTLLDVYNWKNKR